MGAATCPKTAQAGTAVATTVGTAAIAPSLASEKTAGTEEATATAAMLEIEAVVTVTAAAAEEERIDGRRDAEAVAMTHGIAAVSGAALLLRATLG